MFADATLACNGKFFSVHKLVLSACSDYFGDIFYEARGQNPVIILKDIDCKNLEYLLDYMYVGEINVKQKELASLVNVAECLKIKGLAVPDDTPQIKSFHSNDINSSDSNREHNQENSAENFFQNFSEQNNFLKTVNSDVVSENISNDTPLHYDVKVEPLEPGLETEVDNGNKISDFGFLNNLNTNCEDELERNYSCKENVDEERIRLLNFGGPCTPFSSFQDNWESNSQFGDKNEEFSSQVLGSEIPAEMPIHLMPSERWISPRNIGLKHLKKKFTHLKKTNLGCGKKSSYECPHCTYSCNDKSNFKRHVQVHTGEKPYHCPCCRYSCIHSSNLKTHIRNKHANDLNLTQSIEKYYSLSTQLGIRKDSFSIPTPSLGT